jgi:hypothetical protein
MNFPAKFIIYICLIYYILERNNDYFKILSMPYKKWIFFCLITVYIIFFTENRPLPQPVDKPVSIVPFILMLDMFRIKTMELYYLYLHWIFQIAYHMLFFCESQLIYIDYAKKIIIWLNKITLKTSPYKPLIQMKIGTKLCRYCVWKFLCKKKILILLQYGSKTWLPLLFLIVTLSKHVKLPLLVVVLCCT